MKAKKLLLSVAVLFTGIPLIFEEASAAPVYLEPDTQLLIGADLAHMGYVFSQNYDFNEIPNGYRRIRSPRNIYDLEAQNAEVTREKVNIEELSAIHVATSTLKNNTDTVQRFQTQEYSESYTNSVTNTTTHTFKIGVDSKGSIELPIGKGETTLKVEYNFADANSKTTSETKTYVLKSQPVEVQPHQAISVVASLKRARISADLLLKTDLTCKVPVLEHENSNDTLVYDLSDFMLLYNTSEDRGLIPNLEYSKNYIRVNSNRVNYYGGRSQIIADVGTDLVVEFFDVTDGKENAKLINTIVGEVVNEK